jgi:hypothetical protein
MLLIALHHHVKIALGRQTVFVAGLHKVTLCNNYRTPVIHCKLATVVVERITF